MVKTLLSIFMILVVATTLTPQLTAQQTRPKVVETTGKSKKSNKKKGKPGRGFRKKHKGLRVVGSLLKDQGANLTQSQWKKVTTIDSLYAPDWKMVREGLAEILTDEQRARQANAMDASRRSSNSADASSKAIETAIGYSRLQRLQTDELKRRRSQVLRDAATLLTRALPKQHIEPSALPVGLRRSITSEYVGEIELAEAEQRLCELIDAHYRDVESHFQSIQSTLQSRSIVAKHDTDDSDVPDFDICQSGLEHRALKALAAVLSPESWQQLTRFPAIKPHVYRGGLTVNRFEDPNDPRLTSVQFEAIGKVLARWHVFSVEIKRQFAALAESTPEDSAGDEQLTRDTIDRIQRRAFAHAQAEWKASLSAADNVTSGFVAKPFYSVVVKPFLDPFVADLDLHLSQQIRINELERQLLIVKTELDRQSRAISKPEPIDGVSYEGYRTAPQDAATSLDNLDQLDADGDMKERLEEIATFRRAAEKRAVNRMRTILTPEQLEVLSERNEKPSINPETIVEELR